MQKIMIDQQKCIELKYSRSFSTGPHEFLLAAEVVVADGLKLSFLLSLRFCMFSKPERFDLFMSIESKVEVL